MTPKKLATKKRALISRFIEANCDLIAVQEILAKGEAAAAGVLEQFGRELGYAAKRNFYARVGRSNDRTLHLGFLVDSTLFQILEVRSHHRSPLPKLSKFDKVRYFSRGPLEIQVKLRSGGQKSPPLSLFTFHFKSKSGRARPDYSGYQFETLRVRMAEGLRRLAVDRGGSAVVILLGDRNSDHGSATDDILTGERTLEDYQIYDGCKIAKDGQSLCEKSSGRSEKFVSVLTEDPDTAHLGSYVYRSKSSWLDDILISAEHEHLALEKEKKPRDYDSGATTRYPEASDHALVRVKLSLPSSLP